MVLASQRAVHTRTGAQRSRARGGVGAAPQRNARAPPGSIALQSLRAYRRAAARRCHSLHTNARPHLLAAILCLPKGAELRCAATAAWRVRSDALQMRCAQLARWWSVRAALALPARAPSECALGWPSVCGRRSLQTELARAIDGVTPLLGNRILDCALYTPPKRAAPSHSTPHTQSRSRDVSACPASLQPL